MHNSTLPAYAILQKIRYTGFLHFSRIAKGFMRRVDIRHLTNIRFCVILQAGYVGLP